MRSPIEAMIDEACGYAEKSNASPEEVARGVAGELIDHIDEMYPGMWEGVPKSARVSVRNIVFNKVVFALKNR